MVPDDHGVVRLPLSLMRRIDAQLAIDDTWRNRSAWVKACVVRRLEELEGQQRK